MPERLRPLSGLDAGFLYLEAAGTPMHVGSLMRLQAPRRRGYSFHRALQAHVAERLARAPALRRVLREAPLGLGHPFWEAAPTLDLDAHITRETLPVPGTQAQLLARVAQLHALALPRDRPLWQFVVIDGLATGEVMLYTKIHHALLDGQGGVALAQALLDVEPHLPASRRPSSVSDTATRAPDATATRASVRASVDQFARLLRGLPATLKLAAGTLRQPLVLAGQLRDVVLRAPRTPFNAQVGAQRRLATTTLSLERIKQVAAGYGVSVNDVLLQLCTAVLREHLQRRRLLPAKPLVAAMPVSLRQAGNREVNNQVSMVQCVLPTHLADVRAQLQAIAAATRGIKQQVGVFRDLIPTDFPGLAAPLWASGLSHWWARGRLAERLPPLANLVISNVPGPPMALHLAGARLLNNWPVSIVTHGLGLNITAQAYAGQMDIGVIACKDALPKPESLARGLPRALEKLAAKLPLTG